MVNEKRKKVVVIGAGPVGIAAAAHLKTRGVEPVVIEKGDGAGRAIKEWSHVRLFTPWELMVDHVVVELLEKNGWQMPDLKSLPHGKDVVEKYLEPAVTLPELKNHFIFSAEVTAVSKAGLSKSSSKDREEAQFVVHYKSTDKKHHILEVDGVVDASGTWSNPNPIGLDGLHVPGELDNSDHISYGIPDTLGKEREVYEGKKTLVIGGGHSAINVVLDLLRLKQDNPDTRVIWGLRNNNIDKLLGGGLNDALPARLELGNAANKAMNDGSLALLAPFQVKTLDKVGNRIIVDALKEGEDLNFEVDRIVVTAGFRPDMNILRELRLDIDDVVEAPRLLAPLIDPNEHTCGSVRAHGVNELTHIDKGFYIVGMKSYGRAPTFLMKTGYAQVDSIVEEITGVKSSIENACSSGGSVQEALSSCCPPRTNEISDTCLSENETCGSENATPETSPNCSNSKSAEAVASQCCGASETLDERKLAKADSINQSHETPKVSSCC
ncbi:NAD(P)-binding domain-containing protein [Curvivirga aplysinae]|uniref:NAD(P)-binding domain-containing protein n=1 Tax=Curvivirga aplysinae TaxID=2529852 RepID=UPI0012BCDE07|nr:NAD(P)-binding domain-containing protein [Curvivirga aplysinae]MTI08940.1 flavoprotein [Curvivirga aplysinae]